MTQCYYNGLWCNTLELGIVLNNPKEEDVLLHQLEVSLMLGYSYKGFIQMLYSKNNFPKPDLLQSYPGASIGSAKFWLKSSIEIYKTTIQYKARVMRKNENRTI